MTHEQTEDLSLTRALAILAAFFAIVFASLLPSAVAASAATATPIQLCSGQTLRIIYDVDGQPQPDDNADPVALSCAMALLSGLQAIDTPPTVLAEPVADARPQPVAPAPALPQPGDTWPPKPPATAPPHP